MTATTPAASRSLDDIPGPKGVPVLGNMFEIKQATMIQDLMKVAPRVGTHLQDDHPDGADLRHLRPGDGRRPVRRRALRQARRAEPAGVPQDPQERGAVHRGHRRPAVEVRARHPAAQLQHVGDEGLPRPDDRHRRAAVPQVGAAQPGRADRRHRRHDPADPRHDRAVRVQLPVQLVLPRHPAPLHRGDDGRAARDPGPAAPAPDRGQGCAAGPSGSCWPTASTWTTRSPTILAERKAQRRSRAPTCWGTCSSAPTSRATRCPTTTSSPSA